LRFEQRSSARAIITFNLAAQVSKSRSEVPSARLSEMVGEPVQPREFVRPAGAQPADDERFQQLAQLLDMKAKLVVFGD
jgi:hypothetical protein